MAFVPEGQADRSLARSAWDNATPKSRPVGYGVICAGVRRADSMIEVTKFQIPRLKTLRSPWDSLRPIIPYLTGRFFRPRPLIVIVLELELVLGSVILGLKPVCFRVMPAALLQYRN
jgi:hypothetical protein